MQVSAIKFDSSRSSINQNQSKQSKTAIRTISQNSNLSSTVSFGGSSGFFDDFGKALKKFWKDLSEISPEQANKRESSFHDCMSPSERREYNREWDRM